VRHVKLAFDCARLNGRIHFVKFETKLMEQAVLRPRLLAAPLLH
jgi:hypothetical protein